MGHAEHEKARNRTVVRALSSSVFRELRLLILRLGVLELLDVPQYVCEV